jgi:hypothetical protein
VKLQCSQSLALYDSFTWYEGLIVPCHEELTTVQLPLRREAQLIIINDLSILANECLVFGHRIILLQLSIDLRLNQQQPSALKYHLPSLAPYPSSPPVLRCVLCCCGCLLCIYSLL